MHTKKAGTAWSDGSKKTHSVKMKGSWRIKKYLTLSGVTPTLTIIELVVHSDPDEERK